MRTLTIGSIGIPGSMVRYVGTDEAIVDMMQRLFCARHNEPRAPRPLYMAFVAREMMGVDVSSPSAFLDSLLRDPHVAVAREPGEPLVEGEETAEDAHTREPFRCKACACEWDNVCNNGNAHTCARPVFGNPAWMGDTDAVAVYLKEKDAKKDPGSESTYLTRGGAIVFGFGALEIVVPGDTEVCIRVGEEWKWVNLANEMAARGSGIRVTVI